MEGYYSQSLGSDAVSYPTPPTPYLIEQQPTDSSKASSVGPLTSKDNTNEANNTPRKCSVRGCMTVMPVDNTNKMCEACRQRHRGYATTKRLKRKMEKDALNQQSVALLSTEQPARPVWMEEYSAEDEESGHGTTTGVQKQSTMISQIQPEASTSSTGIPVPSYNESQWDNSVLDPRLVSSRSFELAGALTLPSQMPSATAPSRYSSSIGQFPVTEDDSYASSGSQASEADDSMDIDVQHVPKASNIPSSAPVGPVRYCSVKGCKATIPNDYFFKMCEPCRDRYRAYGITKRAKWRAERVAANAELEALRIEEDKRRAEEGLPPLADSPEDWITWQNDIVVGPLLTNTEDKHGPFPPRMCTVSHCHAILTGDYKYRRCEQHRVQNRHHSKLKRIREKDMKAQAAALIPGAENEPVDNSFRMWEPRGESSKRKDDEPGPLFTNTPIELGSRSTTETADDSLALLTGVAGRRKNHTCSIKGCYNLLNPQVPWKMCDPCRDHDRQNRKNKKLREEGRLPPLRSRGKHHSIPQMGSHEPTSSTTENNVLPVAPSNGTLGKAPSAQPDRPLSSSSSSHDVDEVFTDLVDLPDNIPSTLGEVHPLGVPVGSSSTTLERSVQNSPNVDHAEVSSVVEGHQPVPAALEPPLTRKPRSEVKPKAPRKPTAKKANKAKGTAKETVPSTEPHHPDAQPPFPYPPPFSYWPPYYSISQHQHQQSSSSSPEPSSSKSPAAQPPYPYPSPYAHLLAYGNPAFTGHQIHQFSYIPPYMPLHDPNSQSNLQPYGSGLYHPPFFPPPSGIPPAPSNPLKHDPSKIVPVRPRKKRKSEPNIGVGDAELPGPNGSLSFTSVLNFSARPSSASTSAPPPTFTAERDSSSVESEDNADDSPSSNLVPTLSSVNGVPHGTRLCTKPSCHRQLSASTRGAWCDRCQTRLKKRQAKAKLRFKLEPKKPVVPLRAPGP